MVPTCIRLGLIRLAQAPLALGFDPEGKHHQIGHKRRRKLLTKQDKGPTQILSLLLADLLISCLVCDITGQRGIKGPIKQVKKASYHHQVGAERGIFHE